MSTTPMGVSTQLDSLLESWPIQGPVTRREAESLLWFFVYGQNVLSESGRDWTGAVFRQRETTCLLVVKSRYGETQDVVFVTGRTPTDCVVLFRKKYLEESLQWIPDRYA